VHDKDMFYSEIAYGLTTLRIRIYKTRKKNTNIYFVMVRAFIEMIVNKASVSIK
jgi:hypothetical protein